MALSLRKTRGAMRTTGTGENSRSLINITSLEYLKLFIALPDHFSSTGIGMMLKSKSEPVLLR
jgi:hypothetical protein